MANADIRELGLLADIDLISEKYENRFGAPPINLSQWNPSKALIQGLELQLPLSSDLKGIDYAFSYELSERDALIESLGFDSTKHGCLFTHSGSTAIVAACNWLRSVGCPRVLIVGPRYFTVPYALESLGINWTILHMHRSQDGRFLFPILDEKLLSSIGAIWLTSPIYCTGIDYNEGDLNQVVTTASSLGIRIVIDECLSVSGRRIGPKFGGRGIAAIYAPHKSICVNGIKFAVIVFDNSEQEHFDTWCDVWNGCLPTSSVVGIRHYLSSDFLRYQGEFERIIAAQHGKVRAVLAGTPSIALDDQADGYLISVYAPKIRAEAGIDFAFIEQAANLSGAVFIAGARNEMDPGAGLSFRLNLAAMDASALAALDRLCCWLSNKSINQ